MLYMIGTVTLDTAPFSADEIDRDAAADFAEKPVLGAPAPREFTGEGDDAIEISGQLLPSRIGGLTELEALHAFRTAGQTLPVMRGDGRMLGWFVIQRIRERHRDPTRDGVGFTIRHTISMVKSTPEAASPSLLGSLLSIFSVA